MATPLTEDERAVVARNVPAADRLATEERRRFEGLVQLFLDDKSFEGCGGFEITDEVRLTVAAQACLLLVGLDVQLPFPELDAIRIYPGAYRVPVEDLDGSVVSAGHSRRLGQSSGRGYVVLAWDAALRGSRRPKDGDNLVLHEFAHQLDTEDGAADGAPWLDASLARPWAQILSEAFTELQRDAERGRRQVLDAYGATNPAEFFAVATEAFFERSRRLRREHPELYAVLSRYYGQDPAGRSAGAP